MAVEWITIWGCKLQGLHEEIELQRTTQRDDSRPLFRFVTTGYETFSEHKSVLDVRVSRGKAEDLFEHLCLELGYRTPLKHSDLMVQITNEQWEAKGRLLAKCKKLLREAHERIRELELSTKPLPASKINEVVADAW